jgi:MYXO-CTERM domain-containing protein
VPGTPFSLTVTAKNADSSTATDYLGTVHFTSSDSLASLPPDYTYIQGDAGTHTFSGVVLRHTSTQSITASDTVTPFVTGTTTVNVACVGACPSSPGTPGSRAVLPGPTGVAGTRIPIRPLTPAVPRTAAIAGHSAAAVHVTSSAAAAGVGGNHRLSAASHITIKTATLSVRAQLVAATRAPEVLDAAHGVASPPDADSTLSIEVAISLWLLVLAALAIRRRRSGEEFHDQA